ncbi:MAG: RdgB/HAM1 family non-canonical purine NTP pyrophosphatase [Clostridiales bacterium]|nr:RdgB/HAM1 family non-canonical purine NTP pyrophosphatase [Clostridiales bacterium]
MRFVLASKNKHKLMEMRAILSQIGLELISQDELSVDLTPDENGSTFEENALIKAKALFKETGLPCIADDSGLEVDFLGGAPGIHSARYAEGSDHDRVLKLLNALSGVPDGKRQARFVSVIACVLDEKTSFTCRRECSGTILKEIKGEAGFGYDPIFFVPEYNMTFAEMPADIKNQISHRAKALLSFKEELKKIMSF